MASFRKLLPGTDFDVFGVCTRTLATVLAFDPGETTGWAAFSVEPDVLLREHNVGDSLEENLEEIDYGQIDCTAKDLAGWFGVAHKHAGINMAGENAGIEEMVSLATRRWPQSVIVIEDFIPDSRMDKARHTLSPVRITAGFSYGMSRESQRWGGRLGDERIFVQSASLAKTTMIDERLIELGFMDGGHKGRHARDSVRHAFYFLRNARGNDLKAQNVRHLAWPHLYPDPEQTAPERTNRKSRRGLGERI